MPRSEDRRLVVDVHSHYWGGRYLDGLETSGRVEARRAARLCAGDKEVEVEGRLQLMAAAGIDVEVVSAGPEVPEWGLTESVSVRLARLCNESFADLESRYPGKFRSFGVLPWPHVGAALEEAERCLGELNFAGIGVNSTTSGEPVLTRLPREFFEEMNRLGAAVFIHPSGLGCPLITRPYNLTWSVGAVFEDTLAVCHLVESGLVDEFPRIKFLVPHLGGALPIIMMRLEERLAYGRGRAGAVRQALSAIWFDTVSHGHEPGLRCALSSLGSRHLVFGTDYPYTTDSEMELAVDQVVHWSEGTHRAILEENPLELIGALGA